VSVEERERGGSIDQTKVRVQDTSRDARHEETDDKHGGGAEVQEDLEDTTEMTVARETTPPPHAIVSTNTFGASASSLGGNPWA
jgi:hypothetical protein